jgi:DNA-damage-inducible protein D
MNQNDIERVPLRREISEHEKSLNSTAKLHGIEQYALFTSKGYLGLYNMHMKSLRELKGIPEKATPLDYMGAEELGANIFRITQTNAKIQRDNLTGQKALENAAFEVGKTVREAIQKTGGTMPEKLPKETHNKEIKSNLKKTSKSFNNEDNKKIGSVRWWVPGFAPRLGRAVVGRIVTPIVSSEMRLVNIFLFFF